MISHLPEFAISLADPGKADEDQNDQFFVTLIRTYEDQETAAQEWIEKFEATVRDQGGIIQMHSDKTKNWDFLDGKDNHKEPNHLNPAVFDFNIVVIGAFTSPEDMHMWWNSNEVFNIIKWRAPLEKLGIFSIDGLQKAFDVNDRSKVATREKFVLLEFMKMQAFKPVQHYVDCYKRYAERALQEIGIDCNLLYAEGIAVTLMNEFPLDAMCVTTWRMRQDANFWYEADIYQKQLLPLRQEFATSLSMIAPICDATKVIRQEKVRNVLRPLNRDIS